MKPINANKSTAFSLIELLVALAILAVVAALIVPRFLNVRSQASTTTSRHAIVELQNMVCNWKSLGGSINGTATAGDLITLLAQNGRAAGYSIGATGNQVVDASAAVAGTNSIVFPANIGIATAANVASKSSGFYTAVAGNATTSAGQLWYSSGDGTNAYKVDLNGTGGSLKVSRVSTGTGTVAITL